MPPISAPRIPLATGETSVPACLALPLRGRKGGRSHNEEEEADGVRKTGGVKGRGNGSRCTQRKRRVRRGGLLPLSLDAAPYPGDV